MESKRFFFFFSWLMWDKGELMNGGIGMIWCISMWPKHLGCDQNPGFLLYVGDYTTQLYKYKDYNKSLQGSLWTNQYNGMSCTSPYRVMLHQDFLGPNIGSQRSRLWVRRLRDRTAACASTTTVHLGRWVKWSLKLRSSSRTMFQMPLRWRPTASGGGPPPWDSCLSCRQ